VANPNKIDDPVGMVSSNMFLNYANPVTMALSYGSFPENQSVH
jgi:hypothetical protein